MENNTKIGWIGLGHMGLPMATNLVKGGFDLAFYNRTMAKGAPLAALGATACDSVAELSQRSDIVFIMLPDDASVSALFDSIFENDAQGKLFVNMSTISLDATLRFSELCTLHGASYLEAPVSGSVKPATDATLVVLSAGSQADYDRALPYLDTMGKLTLHLGDVGAAAKAKLAINYYMAVVVDGLAETVLFAEQQGIARATMLEIVNAGACASPMSQMKTPAIINDTYPAAFPLKYMLKDLKLSQAIGCRTPLSEVMVAAYQNAVDNGQADNDLMAVIKGY